MSNNDFVVVVVLASSVDHMQRARESSNRVDATHRRSNQAAERGERCQESICARSRRTRASQLDARVRAATVELALEAVRARARRCSPPTRERDLGNHLFPLYI